MCHQSAAWCIHFEQQLAVNRVKQDGTKAAEMERQGRGVATLVF
jgi:hypothetical protein